MVTFVQNPRVNDNDIYMTLSEGWLESLNTQWHIITLRNDPNGYIHVPQLCYDEINSVQRSHGHTHCLASHNLCLHSISNLIPQYATGSFI